jgi:WD40 repeat protein
VVAVVFFGGVAMQLDGRLVRFKAPTNATPFFPLPPNHPPRTSGFAKWQPVARLEGFHTATVYSVDWSRLSGAIASGAADDAIRVFTEDPEQPQGWATDSPSFRCVAHAAGAHAADVNCVRWNPRRAHLLASAGDDQLVKVWRFDPEGVVDVGVDVGSGGGGGGGESPPA